MSENEVELKKHTCPTCGGQLQVNLDKQMYDCLFCGVSFDYSYFREDDVLARAERFRQSGDWSAADMDYDFILTKDPHNFCALRGKVLAAAHVRKGFDLSGKKFSRNQYVLTNIKHALSATDEEHREYFEKLEEYFKGVEKYNEEKIQLDQLREEYEASRRQLEGVENPTPSLKEIMQLGIVKIYAVLVAFEVFLAIAYIEQPSDERFFITINLVLFTIALVGMTAYIWISKTLKKRRIVSDENQALHKLNALQDEITSRQKSEKAMLNKNSKLRLEINEMEKRLM